MLSLCTSPHGRVMNPTFQTVRSSLSRVFGLFLVAGAVTGPSLAQSGDVSVPRTVRFREPHATAYVVESAPTASARALATATEPSGQWTRASASGDPENTVELGSRVVLQLEPGRTLESLREVFSRLELRADRTVSPDLHILQAPDSARAITAAETLSETPGVVASYPVMRRAWRRSGGYAPLPNDPYFSEQWHLDNRGSDRNRTGPDLNVRSAWTVTRGEGVIVGVGDDGVQTTHPDLSPRFTTGLNYNFFRGIPSGSPASDEANHGTSVSGLIAAEGNNAKGLSGVAPGAQMASWVLFGTSISGFESFASDEQMLDMFQYASNRVAIQNHSWGNALISPLPINSLASVGVGNAVTNGRGGLGVVIARAAGNSRARLVNANDDGFANDPRVMAVAAVRRDGLVCSYSSPGACILVGAPSGDSRPTDGDGVATDDVQTTDRTGNAGYNPGTSDAANYTGFDGTSASSPQIAGVAALIVSANTNLTFRDVQHILALSARQTHLNDPAMQTNGAGFRVSHNVGFGIPDAGVAVEMARTWTNLPPPIRVRAESRTRRNIPDDSLRVGLSGTTTPTALRSIRCLPSLGRHPDEPTGIRPLVYVGDANSPITQDLTGKGALIQRGGGLFVDKIERAASAGAAFAVIFNNVEGTAIQFMGGTKFSRIPAVSISQNNGEALRDYVEANPGASGRILLIPTFYTLSVSNTMICTHVGVRLKTSHPRRSDVRVTLISPRGSRSVLQAISNDDGPGPVDWTYWSTQHFYEGTAGDWKVEVSDERDTVVTDPANGDRPATGAVTLVELFVDGIPITDTDRDGLDDAWERSAFGDLSRGPRDDPDNDGYSNAREQLQRMNPNSANQPLRLEWTEFEPGYWRFAWPSQDGIPSAFRTSTGIDQPMSQRASIPGEFPASEFVIPAPADPQLFFEIRAGVP